MSDLIAETSPKDLHIKEGHGMVDAIDHKLSEEDTKKLYTLSEVFLNFSGPQLKKEMEKSSRFIEFNDLPNASERAKGPSHFEKQFGESPTDEQKKAVKDLYFRVVLKKFFENETKKAIKEKQKSL